MKTNATRMLISGLLFLAGSAGLSFLSSPASAAACRDIQSIQQSADLNNNTAMGGHVTQHVLGMQPPPGASQIGKTLFADGEKFRRAWGTYLQISNPRSCSSGGSVQQVFQLGYFLDAFSCRSADARGMCTQWDSFAASEVAVAFIRQPNGTWILNTAYPLPISP